MTLVFGSTALKFWFPDLSREPKDLDVISKESIMTSAEQHYWQESFSYVVENNKHSAYVRFNGWYSSYDGGEYHEGFELVKPKTVQVTNWETDKG